MRNNVSFRTHLFNSHDPQPHFINPICFGQDLALWLLERMRGTALALGEPIQEDYGWGFWAETDYWVALGLRDNAAGSLAAEWLISVDYDPGLSLKKRLSQKPDTKVWKSICAAIDAVLKAEPAIIDLLWCSDNERDCDDAP
jgi:hypothetical protein